MELQPKFTTPLKLLFEQQTGLASHPEPVLTPTVMGLHVTPTRPVTLPTAKPTLARSPAIPGSLAACKLLQQYCDPTLQLFWVPPLLGGLGIGVATAARTKVETRKAASLENMVMMWR